MISISKTIDYVHTKCFSRQSRSDSEAFYFGGFLLSFPIHASQGIGIPEDEQKHLFDKFFRARNTGETQGTGLGLTIVKRYVELLGDTVGFVSKEHQGTTFSITIPLSS